MKCGFCKSKLIKILDLGKTPLANSFLTKKYLKKKEKIYALNLNFCKNCYLIQAPRDVQTKEIFNQKYVYFSSTSKYWLEHAKRYCEHIIKKINKIIKKKIEIFNLYKKYLVTKNIFINPQKKGEINSYWMPTIVLKKSLKIKREYIFRKLNKYKIDSRVFFYPLSILPMFKKNKNNKISYDIYKRGFNLPSYYDLSENNIKKIAKILNKYIS